MGLLLVVSSKVWDPKSLQSTWDGNTNQNTWTWDISTVLSQSYIGNTALLYTFQKQRWAAQRRGCQFWGRRVVKSPPPSCDLSDAVHGLQVCLDWYLQWFRRLRNKSGVLQNLVGAAKGRVCFHGFFKDGKGGNGKGLLKRTGFACQIHQQKVTSKCFCQ